jgi:hypothetical protein
MKRVMWAILVAAMFVSVACTSTADPPFVASAGRTTSGPHILSLSDCPELPCQGPLEPGEYRWDFSQPTIDFAIASPGWTWYYSGSFRIVAAEDGTAEGIYIPDGLYFLHDPAIASQDCEETEERGVGRTVDDLVAWLRAAPGLDVSEPTPVTVGGFEGVQLDLRIDPAWKRPCFFSEKKPVVPLIFNGAKLGGYNLSIVEGQALRWYILETDDGVLLLDLEDDPGGLPHGALLETGTEIVDSLTFSSHN